jgi:hypothetical protein
MAQKGPTIKATCGLAYDCGRAFTAWDLPF